jgi:plastocyanin
MRHVMTLGLAGVMAIAILGCGGNPPAATPPAGPTELDVESHEFEFVPSELTARAGEIKVTLRNTGAVEHDFHIEEIPDAHVLSNVGETNESTFTAAAGTYEFICTVPGHRQAGMVGTLTVTP